MDDNFDDEVRRCLQGVSRTSYCASMSLYEEDFGSESEELVGTEEESKNWKGIVISLIVITFILSMIVLAIALVTPPKVKPEPGDPFTFSQLADKSLQPAEPIFQFSDDGDSYIVHIKNDTDNLVALVNIQNETNPKTDILITKERLEVEQIEDLDGIELSPNGKYALLKVKPTEAGKKSTYRLFDKGKSSIIDDSHFAKNKEIDYVSWLGRENEMVYIIDNEMLYKDDPSGTPKPVVTGSDAVIGIPNKQYKNSLNEDVMVWISPSGDQVIYAAISEPSRSKRDVSSQPSQSTSLTLHSVKPSDPTINKTFAPNDSSGLTHLTSLTWFGTSRIMSVWISDDFSTMTYLLCEIESADCTKNLELKKHTELSWAPLAHAPILSPDGSKYYTILPDPANQKKMYRHIACIKINKEYRDSSLPVNYLTKHQWSDVKLIGIYNRRYMLYLSTGANYTHRHLYSLSLAKDETKCLTCDIDLGTECLFVDATLSKSSKKIFLSCLGPDVPSYHIVTTQSLIDDDVKSHQIRKDGFEKIKSAVDKIKLPVIEYITIPLDSGYEASVKLSVPAIIDREKIYTYGLVVRINSGLGMQSTSQMYPDSLTTYLSKNQSYLVAEVDVRGSANRGEKLRQSVYESLGIKEAYDIQQVISFFQKHWEFYKVNDTMIAIMGQGYGGFVALHALRKDIATCGVVVSPLTDLRNLDEFKLAQYMGNDTTKLATTDLKYICQPGEECHLPSRQNLLLVHGTADEDVSYQNSLDLMRKLQLAGYDFKQQIYPGVGHDIESSQVYKHYYQTITNYLKECFSGNLAHSTLM